MERANHSQSVYFTNSESSRVPSPLHRWPSSCPETCCLLFIRPWKLANCSRQHPRARDQHRTRALVLSPTAIAIRRLQFNLVLACTDGMLGGPCVSCQSPTIELRTKCRGSDCVVQSHEGVSKPRKVFFFFSSLCLTPSLSHSAPSSDRRINWVRNVRPHTCGVLFADDTAKSNHPTRRPNATPGRAATHLAPCLHMSCKARWWWWGPSCSI